jgi:hypothetical protein
VTNVENKEEAKVITVWRGNGCVPIGIATYKTSFGLVN